jgi:hypothetical protein
MAATRNTWIKIMAMCSLSGTSCLAHLHGKKHHRHMALQSRWVATVSYGSIFILCWRWLLPKLLRGGSGMQRTRAQLQFIRWQTGITVAVLFFTLLLCHYLSVVQLALASSFILLGVVATGAMLEQRRWVFYLDFARLHLVGFFIYTFFPQPAVSIFIVVALGLLLAFYKTCSNQYHAILYA